MIYYVYIIRSTSTKKFYTGITNSITRRLQEHNGHESNTKTTKILNDYDLVFCQITESREKARILEKYLKSGVGREIRNEIIKVNNGIVAQPG